jgi:endonuclease YncB( thermonuclease family)
MALKRIIMFLAVIFIFTLISIGLENYTQQEDTLQYEREEGFITRVIDGDTLELNSGEKIRLLGINTPERNKPLYEEAKTFLKEIENTTIQLERENLDKDKYQRKLRYVFDHNRNFNIELVQEGLATTFLLENLFYEEKLRNAEEYAREQGKGLWEKSTHTCAPCIILQELNEKEEYLILKNACPIQCNLSGWTIKDDANHFITLKNIEKKSTTTYQSKGKIWNNEGDRFFLRDNKGKLVLFYEY